MPFDAASLRFDSRGLIPAIAQDVGTGEVLMLAWMNAEAVRRTLESGRVTYW
ncbi:MAG: phosphoribosyl-AMP cyclohydrolase, partial [Alphaproteobacteria bacterium]